jgi:hypothetical protein
MQKDFKGVEKAGPKIGTAYGGFSAQVNPRHGWPGQSAAAIDKKGRPLCGRPILSINIGYYDRPISDADREPAEGEEID